MSLPTEKPGPHHDHQGHVHGDLDPHGHRDKTVPPANEQAGEHHPHPEHKPGDTDQHGHRDKGAKK